MELNEKTLYPFLKTAALQLIGRVGGFFFSCAHTVRKALRPTAEETTEAALQRELQTSAYEHLSGVERRYRAIRKGNSKPNPNSPEEKRIKNLSHQEFHCHMGVLYRDAGLPLVGAWQFQQGKMKPAKQQITQDFKDESGKVVGTETVTIQADKPLQIEFEETHKTPPPSNVKKELQLEINELR